MYLSRIPLFLLFGGILAFSSCVSKKKFTEANMRISSLTRSLGDTESSLQTTRETLQKTQEELDQTKGALSREKELTETLNSRLSQALSTSTSVQQQLTEKERRLLEQQERLDMLQSLLDEQRSVMANLKATVDRALNQYRSDELQVYEEDGKLYVSLQDKLLFPSGSATVNRDGREALGKLSEVLNSNEEIQIMVEGHTDNVPISGRFEDNWALSTARATAIVRILTQTYKVDPERVIASGRSYYYPKAPNDSAEGRARNRRTEIILTPKLDELFKLLGQ
ncbi:MAG: OmpA family protein [Lunatimonas sp.]|uniref:OmpA/MotB family protein n=1 Tax=Lunatimonas sp. TaxID=2060141 RepID=UPI00263B4A98|nr:flagellar motor protein MotB [Lunatimonas sp.]MCC5935664.1 OmpA family protein [Lunatimonas sp.]